VKSKKSGKLFPGLLLEGLGISRARLVSKPGLCLSFIKDHFRLLGSDEVPV